MSLINDALRRASQTERNRPRPVLTPLTMEPTPMVRPSRISALLIVMMALSLLLACWCFWQWWGMRHPVSPAPVAPVVATRPVVAPAPAPKPVAVVPASPVSPIKAAPAPAPAPAPVAPAPIPHPAAPPEYPVVGSFTPTPWPVDLKLNAIFFSKNNPRALINGNIYSVGDDLQGIAIKKIDNDKVTVAWNGHTRVLTLPGQ